MNETRTLYHFTGLVHLESILADGFLRTTDPNIGSAAAGVVWTLDTPTVDFDHGLGDGSPIKGYLLDGPEVYSTNKRRVRVTIEVGDAQPWLTWAAFQPHEPAWVRSIIETGGGPEAAKHWWVVPRGVHCFEWTEVRDMETGETADLEPCRRKLLERVNALNQAS